MRAVFELACAAGASAPNRLVRALWPSRCAARRCFWTRAVCRAGASRLPALQAAVVSPALPRQPDAWHTRGAGLGAAGFPAQHARSLRPRGAYLDLRQASDGAPSQPVSHGSRAAAARGDSAGAWQRRGHAMDPYDAPAGAARRSWQCESSPAPGRSAFAAGSSRASSTRGAGTAHGSSGIQHASGVSICGNTSGGHPSSSQSTGWPSQSRIAAPTSRRSRSSFRMPPRVRQFVGIFLASLFASARAGSKSFQMPPLCVYCVPVSVTTRLLS
jgi:hypothetical protein